MFAQVAAVKKDDMPLAKPPEKIPAGKEIVFRAFDHELKGRYDVYGTGSNLGDIKISETGVITWNPGDEQVGKHWLRISGKSSDGRRHSNMIQIQVVDPPRLPVAEGGTGTAGSFVKLPTEFDVAAMELSEDNQWLVVAHEAENKLSVWDVATNRQVKLVNCPAPRALLWRGKQIYVANFGKGTISIFDSGRNWQLVDQLRVGVPSVLHLSAPRGEHFDGKMIAAAQDDWYWIDAKKDTSKKMNMGSGNTPGVDFTGQQVISSDGRIYSFREPVGTRRPPGQHSSDLSSARQPVRQVRKGAFWFSYSVVFSGMPPQLAKPQITYYSKFFLIPDQARDVVYKVDLKSQSIACVALDADLTTIERRPINLPDNSAVFETMERGSAQYERYPHLAVTENDELTLYVLDTASKSVFTSKIRSFDISSDTIIKARERNKKREFPKFVAVGQSITHQLTDEKGFHQFDSRNGIKVTASGEMTWTPTRDQIGRQRISIQGRFGRRNHTFQISTTVVEEIPAGAKPGFVIFEKLSTFEQITGIAITEDRKQLLLAHEVENKISVWDVEAQKILGDFTTPKPRFVLSRGELVYVANGDTRTISAFSRAQGWKRVNQVTLGSDAFYLSAPQGRHFDGKILATTRWVPTRHTYGKRSTTTIWLVDDNMKPTVVRDDFGVATSSYDGRSFITQRMVGVSPNSNFRFAAYPFPNDKNATNILLGQHTAREFLNQHHPGSAWSSSARVYRGTAPSSDFREQPQLQIPDFDRCLVYRLSENAVTCVAMNDAESPIGTKTVLLTMPMPRDRSSYDSRNPLARLFISAQHYEHIAATLGDKTHFFLFDQKERFVMYTSVDAFDVNPVVNAASEINCGRNRFPIAVAVGKQQRFALLGKAMAGKFELQQAPDGATVSPEGLLDWTPGQVDLGRQKIVVRAEVGNNSAVIKLDTRVVLPEDLPRALANPAGFENTGMLRLASSQSKLRYSGDGKTMLLLNGDLLREISRDGKDVLMTAQIQPASNSSNRRSFYTDIGKRASYFVALSPRTVDILDKDTLKVVRSIALTLDSQPYLGLHPAKPLCYVPLIDSSQANSLRQFPVIEIDEERGTFRRLGRTFGTGLSVDPRGRYLYTVLRQQTNEERFVVGRPRKANNVQWMMMCYSLNDGGAQIKLLRTVKNQGTQFTRLVVAPDGQNLAYVSPRNLQGAPETEIQSLPHGAGDDATKFEGAGLAMDIAYHPSLPIVATAGFKKILLYDRASGAPIENVLQLPEGFAMEYINRMMFAPNGRRLLVAGREPASSPILRFIDLNLSPDQLASNSNGYIPPPIERLALRPDDAVVRQFSPNDLQALQPTEPVETSARQIARRYIDCIVAVQGGQVSGTGFVVGSQGYVLTTFDAVPAIGEPEIYFRLVDGERVSTRKASAKLVREDQEQNLALLKFSPAAALKTVPFGKASQIGIAEDISVLFSPDSEPESLSPSVLKGIIKTANREIEGQQLVEISIKPNAAMNGAPIFGSQGQVIGVVAGRQAAGEMSLGIPIHSVVDFLKGENGAAASNPAPVPSMRTWVDASGKFRVKATFVRMDAATVHLKLESGQTIKVPLARLSQTDQQFIKKLQPSN